MSSPPIPPEKKVLSMSAMPMTEPVLDLLENVIGVCRMEAVETSTAAAWETSTETASSSCASSAFESLFSYLIIQVSLLLGSQRILGNV
jgi:hypothetical protein